MKILKKTLVTNIFEQLNDKEINTTNTIHHSMYPKITIRNNKNIFLDPIFPKPMHNAQWHTGNLYNNHSSIADEITLFNFAIPSNNFNEFNTRLSATKSI